MQAHSYCETVWADVGLMSIPARSMVTARLQESIRVAVVDWIAEPLLHQSPLVVTCLGH